MPNYKEHNKFNLVFTILIYGLAIIASIVLKMFNPKIIGLAVISLISEYFFSPDLDHQNNEVIKHWRFIPFATARWRAYAKVTKHRSRESHNYTTSGFWRLVWISPVILPYLLVLIGIGEGTKFFIYEFFKLNVINYLKELHIFLYIAYQLPQALHVYLDDQRSFELSKSKKFRLGKR